MNSMAETREGVRWYTNMKGVVEEKGKGKSLCVRIYERTRDDFSVRAAVQ